MTDKQIIIEDCPYFIGGNCQEYLDGVCQNHNRDLKIIRKLEQKLFNKRKECDELCETVKSQKEEIKNLNYTLYEERNLTTDLAKANLKIATLERALSSVRNRFKHENQQNKEIIKCKEQECEELKEKYKWYDHYKEQALYNKNLCNEKSGKIDQLKADREEALKQLEFVKTLNTVREAEIRKLFKTLAEIKYITENHKATAHCDYLTDMDKILQKISEVENEA